MNQPLKTITVLTISDLRFEANLYRKVMTLKDAGYRVRLFAVYSAEVDPQKWEGIELIRIRLTSNPSAVRFFQYMIKSVFWIIRQTSDLFISYDYLPLPACFIKRKISATPFIYDSVELVVGMNQVVNRPVRRLFWKWYERTCIGNASAVIMVCESDARHFQSVYPFREKPDVVRNIPVLNRSEGDEAGIRRKFEIPDEDMLGIYQGMVFEGRGLRHLIRAVHGIEHFRLLIVGEGPLLPVLKGLVDELGLDTHVIFTGGIPFDELSAYTQAADIGFSIISGKGLSYYHALPNKLFEYIQSGKPVIGSDYPEISKVIMENRIGYVVPPDSVEAISDAIRAIILPENYKAFQKSVTKIRDKYTWQKEAKAYLEVVSASL